MEVVYLLFNFTQNNTVHTYKCHIIQYGLFFSVACLTREGDLIALSGTRWLPGFARVPCNASSPCHGICTQSQGQGPVCEWLVCEYTTSVEVSLPPLLPCSLSFSLNPSSTHFLPPLFPSRRPCLVRSFSRSFPSSTLPLTLPYFTGAPSLPPSIPPSLPPSPTYLPPLPPSLPPLPPSALTTRPPRPPHPTQCRPTSCVCGVGELR